MVTIVRVNIRMAEKLAREKHTSLFWGPGKSTAPLSAMYSLLLPTASRPNDYFSSVGVTLACYQQAGSGGKYICVSRKWRR
jgi:hypothetical protein